MYLATLINFVPVQRLEKKQVRGFESLGRAHGSLEFQSGHPNQLRPPSVAGTKLQQR